MFLFCKTLLRCIWPFVLVSPPSGGVCGVLGLVFPPSGACHVLDLVSPPSGVHGVLWPGVSP